MCDVAGGHVFVNVVVNVVVAPRYVARVHNRVGRGWTASQSKIRGLRIEASLQ